MFGATHRKREKERLREPSNVIKRETKYVMKRIFSKPQRFGVASACESVSLREWFAYATASAPGLSTDTIEAKHCTSAKCHNDTTIPKDRS